RAARRSGPGDARSRRVGCHQCPARTRHRAPPRRSAPPTTEHESEPPKPASRRPPSEPSERARSSRSAVRLQGRRGRCGRTAARSKKSFDNRFPAGLCAGERAARKGGSMRAFAARLLVVAAIGAAATVGTTTAQARTITVNLLYVHGLKDCQSDRLNADHTL